MLKHEPNYCVEPPNEKNSVHYKSWKFFRLCYIQRTAPPESQNAPLARIPPFDGFSCVARKQP